MKCTPNPSAYNTNQKKIKKSKSKIIDINSNNPNTKKQNYTLFVKINLISLNFNKTLKTQKHNNGNSNNAPNENKISILDDDNCNDMNKNKNSVDTSSVTSETNRKYTISYRKQMINSLLQNPSKKVIENHFNESSVCSIPINTNENKTNMKNQPVIQSGKSIDSKNFLSKFKLNPKLKKKKKIEVTDKNFINIHSPSHFKNLSNLIGARKYIATFRNIVPPNYSRSSTINKDLSETLKKNKNWKSRVSSNIKQKTYNKIKLVNFKGFLGTNVNTFNRKVFNSICSNNSLFHSGQKLCYHSSINRLFKKKIITGNNEKKNTQKNPFLNKNRFYISKTLASLKQSIDLSNTKVKKSFTSGTEKGINKEFLFKKEINNSDLRVERKKDETIKKKRLRHKEKKNNCYVFYLTEEKKKKTVEVKIK